MRRIGKGFSRFETPLFEEVVTTATSEDVLDAVLEDVHDESIPSPAPPTPPPQLSQDIPSTSQAQSPPQQPQSLTPAQPQEKTKEVKDIIDDAQVEGRHAEKQAEIYQIDLDHPSKVLSMQEHDSEVKKAIEVVTTAKLITKVVNAASTPVSTASAIIPAAEPNVRAAAPTVVPVTAAYTRRRKGVIIRDPEEESTPIKLAEIKSKDKGKGIMIEEPKPMKEKDQTMFRRPDGQDNVWKSQRSVHGQAMVKRWKLLTSCGVHIISFTTAQLILLVERRYPLSKFTLEQMVNVVRLQVEEQSEMSLELLRLKLLLILLIFLLLAFGVDAAKELKTLSVLMLLCYKDASKLKSKLLMINVAAAGSSEEITK
nr:hypothetical protein [Tanacetum cinerariifolium]